MERLYSHIVGSPVFVEEAPRPLSAVQDVVIDPLNGEVVAFVLNAARRLIVVPRDVVSWKRAVYIDSPDAVVEAEDIVRVQRILDEGGHFMRNRVEAEDGGYLGRVFDLAIGVASMQVKTLYVAKDVLGMFRSHRRLISAQDIVEVRADKIIVKNDLIVVKEHNEVPVEDLAVG